MTKIKKIYGPYMRSDGRKQVVFYDGKRTTTKQWKKFLMETALGRQLNHDESVISRDGDYNNTDISNLMIMTHSEATKRQNKLAKKTILKVIK